ncbi:MAG: fibronectin type III domain-containing protein, partial [Desulfosalsimonadaceae bacterium]|nr:fibronectin type III domain-containing protein [Desulfosalsimonadaceae bacterium]
MISGLVNGTVIYYQVGAKNASGITWSIQNSVTAIGLPSAPSAISSTAGNTQATITWTAGTGSTSSLIRYGTVSGSYITTIDPATSPRVISGLVNGTIVYYQVGAKNAAGTTWSVQNSVTPVGLPSAPTAISSTAGNTQATITWTAGAGSTSSLIRYGTVSGSYTTTIDPATAPRIISGVVNGTTVYYQVGAKNAAGTTWSIQNSVTPVGPPSAPTAISSTAGSTQATIIWTAGTGSASSLIKYGTTSGVYTTTIDPATSPRTITGLINGTSYYYQVGARNVSGTTWSSEYSFVPFAVTAATVNVAIDHHVGMTESGGVFVD